jgi:hypothetical protein
MWGPLNILSASLECDCWSVYQAVNTGHTG